MLSFTFSLLFCVLSFFVCFFGYIFFLLKIGPIYFLYQDRKNKNIFFLTFMM